VTWSDDVIIAAAQEVARENFAELHAQGLRAVELAERTGLAVSTVYRRIERLGMAAGKGGPPRITHCKRGHDMAVHGREIPKERGGGRYCSECKRMRERVGANL
jgi:transposase